MFRRPPTHIHIGLLMTLLERPRIEPSSWVVRQTLGGHYPRQYRHGPHEPGLPAAVALRQPAGC
jgi:hypothetical protein